MKDMDCENNQSYCKKEKKNENILVLCLVTVSTFPAILIYWSPGAVTYYVKEGNNKELEKICQEHDYYLFTNNWEFLGCQRGI